eukprot:PhM_4_TR8844/c0_g1_i1/m.55998
MSTSARLFASTLIRPDAASPTGSLISPLVCDALSRRCDACAVGPVDTATSSPSLYSMRQRWYSGRSRSNGSASVTRARRTGWWRAPAATPRSFRTTGTAKRWKHTKALTGLPGRPIHTASLSAASGRGIVANVVGLPGFMLTRPKWIVPPAPRTAPLTTSNSPIETPPVESTTSHLRVYSAWCTLRPVAVVSSRHMPKSTTSAAGKTLLRADMSIGRLLSKMVFGLRRAASVASASSSPVDSTPTTTGPYVSTSVTPTEHRSASSTAPSVVPVGSTSCPIFMSVPTGRMSCPTFAAFLMRMEISRSDAASASTSSVSSTWITASAPSGTAEPVVTRNTWPAASVGSSLP